MPATAIGYELTKWTEQKGKGVFTAQMEWTLKTTISSSIADMAPSKIAGLFTLPYEGVNYAAYNSLWPLATCRMAKCEQIDGGVFRYSTDWSDENTKDGQQATNENPLLDLPIIKPTGGSRDRAIHKDRNDEAILNTAGDPVAQSIEDNTIGLSVTANVAIDSGVEAAVVALRNKVNDSPISIGNWNIGTNKARVFFGGNFLSEVKRRNDIPYYEFTYEILIDERDSHKGVPLNAGFRQRVEVPGSLGAEFAQKTIVLRDGSEPSDPVPLDTDGVVITDPRPDTVIFLEIEKYEEADFSILPGVN
jgi:hypothetical protein